MLEFFLLFWLQAVPFVLLCLRHLNSVRYSVSLSLCSASPHAVASMLDTPSVERPATF